MHRMFRMSWVALALAVAPLAGFAAEVHVTISGYAFAPARITVRPGDTVVWTNRDSVPHTITALGGGFASAALDTGESFTHAFPRAGSFGYRCAIHPEMQGTVLVSPSG
ncbi:MAG TPA: cupredoxin family copper-binding protein [Acetobacteraceae bacterium]|nr:cupredoxin family copper-binding protein [Acetobacteraceae bacterium]